MPLFFLIWNRIPYAVKYEPSRPLMELSHFCKNIVLNYKTRSKYELSPTSKTIITKDA